MKDRREMRMTKSWNGSGLITDERRVRTSPQTPAQVQLLQRSVLMQSESSSPETSELLLQLQLQLLLL